MMRPLSSPCRMVSATILITSASLYGCGVATGQSGGGYFHPLHQRQHSGLWVALWLAQLVAEGIDKPRGFIAASRCYSLIKCVLKVCRNAEGYQIRFTHCRAAVSVLYVYTVYHCITPLYGSIGG